MNDVIYLISTHYESDEIGNQIPVTDRKKVYCSVCSVTQSEFYAAGSSGLHPAYKMTMFRHDYSGEELVEYGEKTYHVYRTYMKNSEEIELHMEERVGK